MDDECISNPRSSPIHSNMQDECLADDNCSNAPLGKEMDMYICPFPLVLNVLIVGVGGMRGYLEFLLAPLFLEVILIAKKVMKKRCQKVYLLAVCPSKNPILALLAKNWLFESRKGHLLHCFK